MPGTLENKVVLVTGAGSGIGRVSSLVLAREGARVVVSDINASSAEETLVIIKGRGGEGAAVHADVSKAYDVRALVAQVVETYGQLDCAYNNAGVEGSLPGHLHDYPEESWDRLIDVNLKGGMAVPQI